MEEKEKTRRKPKISLRDCTTRELKYSSRFLYVHSTPAKIHSFRQSIISRKTRRCCCCGETKHSFLIRGKKFNVNMICRLYTSNWRKYRETINGQRVSGEILGSQGILKLKTCAYETSNITQKFNIPHMNPNRE